MPHSDVDDSASCAPSFTTEASDASARGARRGAKKYKWHKRFAYQKFVGWRPILTPRIAGAPPPPPLERRPPPASRAALPNHNCCPCCRAVLHGRGGAAPGAGHPRADCLAQCGGGGCSPPAAALYDCSCADARWPSACHRPAALSSFWPSSAADDILQ